jgi:hypothetical protein
LEGRGVVAGGEGVTRRPSAESGATTLGESSLGEEHLWGKGPVVSSLGDGAGAVESLTGAVSGAGGAASVGTEAAAAAEDDRAVGGVVLQGLVILTERGINTSERGGQANLPRLIIEYGLAEGCTQKQLNVALRSLIGEGRIVRGETGRDASRRRREGLILATNDQSGPGVDCDFPGS